MANQNVFMNPYAQMGLGILGSNYGPDAFNRAIQGGLLGLNRYQQQANQAAQTAMLQQQIQQQATRQQQAFQMAQQQAEQERRRREAQQRALAQYQGAVSPQMGPPMSEQDALNRLMLQASMASENPTQTYMGMRKAMAPQPGRPFVVGDNLVDPTGKLLYKGSAAGGIKPEDRFKMERSLAGDFSKDTAAFREISDAWATIQSIPSTAIGDVALTTKIMKMLDPDSVVRESELGLALGATGLLQRFENLVRQAQTGAGLNKKQKAEFKNLARQIYNTAQKEFQRRKTRYERQAKEYSLNPANVVYDYSAMPTAKEVDSLVNEAFEEEGK